MVGVLATSMPVVPQQQKSNILKTMTIILSSGAGPLIRQMAMAGLKWTLMSDCRLALGVFGTKIIIEIHPLRRWGYRLLLVTLGTGEGG